MHKRQPARANHCMNDNDLWRDDLAVTVEREFTEFTALVTKLFGPKQAALSAEDWLNEVASRHTLPGPQSVEWRLVTVAALARLTIRMTADLQALLAARRDH